MAPALRKPVHAPTITAVAPWFGSNRTLAHHAAMLLNTATWIGVPFAGGMAELAHLRARTIVVSDIHRSVINLARVMADPTLGAKLYRELRRLPYHPDVLAESQGYCTTHEPSAELDYNAAKHYFIAVWMGRSAKAGTDEEFEGKLPVRWTASGGDSATRFRSAAGSIVAWRRILTRCNFVLLDAFDFLEGVNDRPDHGLYLDPPFPGPGEAYTHKFAEQQHRRLAGELSKFQKCQIVCRYYDHPLIQELYPTDTWHWHQLIGRKQSGAAAFEEVLISRRVP